MLLAFRDARTEAVCMAPVRADAAWGQTGRRAVTVCVDLLATAPTFGALRRFAMLTVGFIALRGATALAVRHDQAEVIVLPIDTGGALQPIATGADMSTLTTVTCLQVLQASWAGQLAHEARVA